MLLDIFNRPIKPEATVCYPARHRSRCWMGTLRVTHVSPDRLSGWAPSGRHITLWGGTLNHLVIVRDATLQEAADRRRELATN